MTFAGRVRQHLTKIMRHAYSAVLSRFSLTFDTDDVVTRICDRHHPALPLKRLPELLENRQLQAGYLTGAGAESACLPPLQPNCVWPAGMSST